MMYMIDNYDQGHIQISASILNMKVSVSFTVSSLKSKKWKDFYYPSEKDLNT